MPMATSDTERGVILSAFPVPAGIPRPADLVDPWTIVFVLDPVTVRPERAYAPWLMTVDRDMIQPYEVAPMPGVRITVERGVDGDVRKVSLEDAFSVTDTMVDAAVEAYAPTTYRALTNPGPDTEMRRRCADSLTDLRTYMRRALIAGLRARAGQIVDP